MKVFELFERLFRLAPDWFRVELHVTQLDRSPAGLPDYLPGTVRIENMRNGHFANISVQLDRDLALMQPEWVQVLFEDTVVKFINSERQAVEEVVSP